MQRLLGDWCRGTLGLLAVPLKGHRLVLAKGLRRCVIGVVGFALVALLFCFCCQWIDACWLVGSEVFAAVPPGFV